MDADWSSSIDCNKNNKESLDKESIYTPNSENLSGRYMDDEQEMGNITVIQIHISHAECST